MKPIRVEVKVKNNILYRAIFKEFKSVSEFCLVHALNNGDIGRLLALKEHPKHSQTGAWRVHALKAADALRRHPEDLFPEELYASIESPKEAVIEVGLNEVRNLMVGRGGSCPEIGLVENNLLRDEIDKVLSELEPREKEIIERRYFMFQTLTEAGKAMRPKITPERVFQIEAKAIRKIRHPRRSRRLRDFIPDNGDANAITLDNPKQPC
jgi:RNA polymerase sigma factor (sigma-70 family)